MSELINEMSGGKEGGQGEVGELPTARAEEVGGRGTRWRPNQGTRTPRVVLWWSLKVHKHDYSSAESAKELFF